MTSQDISSPFKAKPTKTKASESKPIILAPAGSKDAFLAALAAGADAVYCGFKSFSARMAAKNFSINDLAALTRLAHDQGTEVYITINSLIKPDELNEVGALLRQLSRTVKPDALIVQDLALMPLAKQADFKGKLHLSTLANISFPSAMNWIHQQTQFLKADRIVLPRELNIDEIKTFAASCPSGIDLEVFIHGALCYAVSGRCYWSSFLGGKSGLRGRCVQPCRRMYSQSSSKNRFFSCQDLSIDILVKVLLTIPQIKVWKIEGRKKGPHYVYYTVKAYQMLRDEGHDAQARKAALELLSRSLGRKSTHYNFLPQRPQNPVNSEEQTGSGMLMGAVKGDTRQPYIIPREALYTGDMLRIGYEDDPRHSLIRVTRSVPKKGRLNIKAHAKKRSMKGMPVFLTDRREPALKEMLTKLANKMPEISDKPTAASRFNVRLPRKKNIKKIITDLHVHRFIKKHTGRGQRYGAWMTEKCLKNMPRKQCREIGWWLPPVIWPSEESRWQNLIEKALENGATWFVLNAPWQMAFFKAPEKQQIWAGPFCNLANPLAIQVMAEAGCKGAIVSPELGGETTLSLPGAAPIPLGVVLYGDWPLGISRIQPDDISPEKAFTSPKGEQSWLRSYGETQWLFPNWCLDIRDKKEALINAGYSLFVNLHESPPVGISRKNRPGLWNWRIDLA